jgi:hypothetical protein
MGVAGIFKDEKITIGRTKESKVIVGSACNGSVTVYTVPFGKSLYIFHMKLAASAGGNGNVTIYDGNGNVIMSFRADQFTGDHDFPIPFKVPYLGRIVLDYGPSGYCAYLIINGWLE